MKIWRLSLSVMLILIFSAATYSQSQFQTSLHKTRAGKIYWYGKANGGFENFTNVPVDSIGCVKCHGPKDADGNTYPVNYEPSCVDCHPTNSSFNPDSIKVDQCLSCHSRQKTEYMTLGYTDVHRTRGFKCWDCHTNADMHGDGNSYNSMLQPEAISIDCIDCHNSGSGTLPDHTAYDPHGGKVHCSSCHAKTVASCYNCHFESQVETQIKRAKQTIHGFMLLVNREEDGKVYPATFQSLTYQGNAFVAFGPYTAHTIDSAGRVCTDCHVNFGGTVPAILEYNNDGQIYFAKWNSTDSTLQVKTGIVPMPEDYQRSFKLDFLTYNGSTSDPAGPSKNWSWIGKNTWDGHQMFFATPLTKSQMAKLGFDTTITSVETNNESIPTDYDLKTNYPNPFNPSTRIEFTLPKQDRVSLTVYDLTGKEIKTLIDNKILPAGTHAVNFNADKISSGIYLYKLTTTQITKSKKMAFLK